MKLKDIQPWQVHALYSRNSDDFAYSNAGRVFFLPNQLTNESWRRDKSKIYGMVWTHDWYRRTFSWQKQEVSLSKVQELYPLYEQRKAEEKKQREIQNEQNRLAREENDRKRDELFEYIESKQEALANIGLVLPSWLGKYHCNAGEIQVVMTKEIFEKLLAMSEVNA